MAQMYPNTHWCIVDINQTECWEQTAVWQPRENCVTSSRIMLSFSLHARGRQNILYYHPVPVRSETGFLTARSVDNFIHLSWTRLQLFLLLSSWRWNNNINVWTETEIYKKLFVFSGSSYVVGEWVNFWFWMGAEDRSMESLQPCVHEQNGLFFSLVR